MAIGIRFQDKIKTWFTGFSLVFYCHLAKSHGATCVRYYPYQLPTSLPRSSLLVGLTLVPIRQPWRIWINASHEKVWKHTPTKKQKYIYSRTIFWIYILNVDDFIQLGRMVSQNVKWTRMDQSVYLVYSWTRVWHILLSMLNKRPVSNQQWSHFFPQKWNFVDMISNLITQRTYVCVLEWCVIPPHKMSR